MRILAITIGLLLALLAGVEVSVSAPDYYPHLYRALILSIASLLIFLFTARSAGRMSLCVIVLATIFDLDAAWQALDRLTRLRTHAGGGEIKAGQVSNVDNIPIEPKR